MILEIQHETRFEYAEPAMEALTELHLEPVTDADQTCHSFHLAIAPPTEVFRYQDGFGNRVHHFNLLTSHDRVSTLGASVVVTHPRFRDLSASRCVSPFPGPGLARRQRFPDLSWACPSDPVARADSCRAAAASRRGAGSVSPPGGRLHSRSLRVSPRRHAGDSPIDDLLKHGKGVCQDFTHLMIAVLRSFGIPARYVSGYIHRPGRDSQSHAWCEAWLPDLGWVGVDPTNDRLMDDNFVKVAIGRDFSDVPPNKGVYRGNGAETISVRVETRALDRLPSLSWQEQLPPLNVPLTAIVRRLRGRILGDSESEQQQQ